MQNADNNNRPTATIDREKMDLVELILNDIGGTFRKYQILNYILFCIPFALSGTFGLSYVFTALNLDYRCFIPECELFETTTYEPIWLSNAVPYKNHQPLTCERYETNIENEDIGGNRTKISESLYTASVYPLDACRKEDFNRLQVVRCQQHIFKTDKVTILNEFNLLCPENTWKLALVGTINNMGRFIFTPIMGHMSDQFGRRTILIVGVFGSSIFALCRSLASSYIMFVVFEFLDAGIGSVTYSAAFILAMEWIGVKDRVLLGSIVTATYPIGQIFLGVTAREIRNFRTLLQIIYAPGLLIVAYIWLAPESIRWLIVNGNEKRTMSTLDRAQRINKVKLSPNTIELINAEFNDRQSSAATIDDKSQQLRQIFRKRVFFSRFLICAFLWATSAFVSYGISLTSIALAGDKYVNFMVIAVAGIPAMLFCYILMETCGRRLTLCTSLLIGGASIIGSKLLPLNFSILSITFFFIGKCFITVAFTGLYVYTSELWPTNVRHSMMGLCSTIGRIGAMFAPLAPILGQYLEVLPYLAFGGMAIIAAVLVLQLPETLNKKLPDTLAEAENIGCESVDETS